MTKAAFGKTERGAVQRWRSAIGGHQASGQFDPERFVSAITLRQIRYFVAAAECGKVSLAAAMVGISPSAITDAVGELETQSGVSLFERHARGLALTFEGHRFLAHCRSILSAVKDACNAFSGRDNAAAGVFTLATSSTVVGYFIAPLLARFKKAFPNIETKLVEGDRTDIVRGLLEGGYDLAIALVSNFPAHRELGSHVLMQSPRRLWLAPKHPLLTQGKVTLADVAKQPYIQLTIDGAEGSTARYWTASGHRPNVVFRTESVEAVRGLIAFGHGVTILADMMYRPWSLEGDRVEVCEIAERIPTLDMGLLWKGDSVANPSAVTFQTFCQIEGGARTLQSRAVRGDP